MWILVVLFFNDTAPTEIYTYCHTLALHDALPSYWRPDNRGCRRRHPPACRGRRCGCRARGGRRTRESGSCHVRPRPRSEAHTSELQSLMRSSYAVVCLKQNNRPTDHHDAHRAEVHTTALNVPAL